jgi:DNA-binding MarR family transcriptional regulator
MPPVRTCMSKPDMKRTYRELSALFFATRQIIRSKLPDGGADPNAWLRFETLRFIEGRGEPTMREVASYLHIKAPSATSLVSHLAKMGLVERRVGKEDRRVKRLMLTAQGRRALAAYHTRTERILHDVFSRLPEGDIRELARLLRQVRELHE